MHQRVRQTIRRVFLNPHPSLGVASAATLLGISVEGMRSQIAMGAIVAEETPLGLRVRREELIALVMQVWDQHTVEEALGAAASRLLPKSVRLVDLQARVPWYQREVLRRLARRERTSVDRVLTRELEDLVCAHAEEMGAEVRGALHWPG
jgi:hypothetical protein